MTDYTITTNFGAKDSLPSGNAAKVIKGSEFTTEFTNIATAVNSKANTAGDTFTGVVSFDAAVTVNSTATITGDLTVDTDTLFVDVSTGKVGIGTDNPTHQFMLKRNDGTLGHSSIGFHPEYESGGGSYIRWGGSSAAGAIFRFVGVGDAERMRIDASGNVGMGTASPNAKLHVAGNGKFDGGASTVLDVLCDDGGTADIKAMGGSQSNGRVYVGQSNTFGGGIEYSGSENPALSGGGSDQIVLYRRSNGTNYWTARNHQSHNNWEFRGEVTATAFNGVGSIQYTDVSVYSNTDNDQQINYTLPSGAQVINAVVTTADFDTFAIRQIRNNGCVLNRMDTEGNQTINLRVWHTQI